MSSAEERIAIGRAGELDELLAGVFAVLPAALALFGATDGDFRIVQWNDDFERLLGADRRLVPGETLEEVFHRAERQAITELFRRVRASKEPGGLFAPDFERPGPAMATILWNLDAYPVMGEGGRVTHIVAVAQRTLERLAARERQARETVRLRERAEHLQELERAKSEFLNLASHELRGPAATLRGYLSVLGDTMRLDIIVSNLVDNAVKYSPLGGDVDVVLSIAGELVLVSVRDHGIGIAPEDIEHLFVRFSRLAVKELSDVPGTGLGLYLARELARLHGGDIMAISRKGEGSEFTLSLPLLHGTG